MGMYLNPEEGTKEDFLLKHGVAVSGDLKFEDTPSNNSLVCLVDNGPFTAAGVAYDKKEFDDFSDPSDYRPKTWFYVHNDLILEHCPQPEYYKKMLKGD